MRISDWSSDVCSSDLVSPDGAVLVNTSETTNMAHFIDTASHAITDNVLVDARPRFAEFSPDGSQVWVSAEIGGTVSVIDNASRQVVHTIRFEIAGIRRESTEGRRGRKGWVSKCRSRGAPEK